MKTMIKKNRVFKTVRRDEAQGILGFYPGKSHYPPNSTSDREQLTRRSDNFTSRLKSQNQIQRPISADNIIKPPPQQPLLQTISSLQSTEQQEFNQSNLFSTANQLPRPISLVPTPSTSEQLQLSNYLSITPAPNQNTQIQDTLSIFLQKSSYYQMTPTSTLRESQVQQLLQQQLQNSLTQTQSQMYQQQHLQQQQNKNISQQPQQNIHLPVIQPPIQIQSINTTKQDSQLNNQQLSQTHNNFNLNIPHPINNILKYPQLKKQINANDKMNEFEPAKDQNENDQLDQTGRNIEIDGQIVEEDDQDYINSLITQQNIGRISPQQQQHQQRRISPNINNTNQPKSRSQTPHSPSPSNINQYYQDTNKQFDLLSNISDEQLQEVDQLRESKSATKHPPRLSKIPNEPPGNKHKKKKKKKKIVHTDLQENNEHQSDNDNGSNVNIHTPHPENDVTSDFDVYELEQGSELKENELQQLIKMLKYENKRLKQQINDLEQLNNQLRNENDQLNQEIARLKIFIQSQKNQIDLLTLERDSLLKKNKELEERYN